NSTGAQDDQKHPQRLCFEGIRHSPLNVANQELAVRPGHHEFQGCGHFWNNRKLKSAFEGEAVNNVGDCHFVIVRGSHRESTASDLRSVSATITRVCAS